MEQVQNSQMLCNVKKKFFKTANKDHGEEYTHTKKK